MQVIKPVDTCSICQSQIANLKDLYSMYKALPEPGAQGILSAALDEYNQHHKEQHPIHPDTLAKRQVIKDLIKEFEGLQIYGVVGENGRAILSEGVLFVYKNHLVAMGPDGVEDIGIFDPAQSAMTLEERCNEVWDVLFGYEEEAINAPTR